MKNINNKYVLEAKDTGLWLAIDNSNIIEVDSFLDAYHFDSSEAASMYAKTLHKKYKLFKIKQSVSW